jgi:hypothetical protein
VAGRTRPAAANNQPQEIVIERSKSYCLSFRLSVLLVMLGTCVFIWGLAYKLSLYDAHQPTLHKIPEAKLLSKNEDPNATDSLRLCVASAMAAAQVGLFFCTGLIFLAPIGVNRSVFQWSVRPLNGARPQLRFILSAFFFRPPPIHSVQ